MMDIEKEIAQSIRKQTRLIAKKAQKAIDRLYRELHVVGVGLCMCGSRMEAHTGQSDDHFAVEQYRDKMFAPVEAQ